VSKNGVPGSLAPRAYLSASRAAWTFLDFVMAIGCGGLVVLVHGAHTTALLTPPSPSWKAFPVDVALVVGLVLFAAGVATLSRLFGLQPFRSSRAITSELLLIVASVSLASFARDGVLRLWVLTDPVSEMLQLALTCSALALCRMVWRRHWDRRSLRGIAAKNILIVGNDPTGREVRKYLESLAYAGYCFKGFVALNEGSVGESRADGTETVGNIDDVITLARSLFVDEIIFSHRPATKNTLSDVLSQAGPAGIDVRLIPSISEKLKRRADVEYIGDLPTIVLNYRDKRAMSHLVKRAADIVLAGTAMLAMSPLLLVIAILIKLQSTGPVFYRGKRVGYKGRVFTCYKFRTMIEHADRMGGQYAHLNERRDILFKIAKDPRLTQIGPVLRKYSLDELPQLWNVLCGDMSLVGPRPSIESEVAQYKTAHLRRLDVVPGMTGLWQVEARCDPSFESYIRLDSQYVREWSLWLDLTIILRTVTVVLKGTGT
jgi:exopolysaccharide biosynthesis polyprenyl glycosylphosphotransferase